jgi:hypothetical protein
VGGLFVGGVVIKGTAVAVSPFTGMADFTVAVGAMVLVGCAILIGWQEYKNTNRKAVIVNFLSTFGVYHKNKCSTLD